MIKNQVSKSQNVELNLQKMLARKVCKITENGEVLWNEDIFVRFLEKSGFRKIKLIDSFQYVQIQGDTVLKFIPERMWNYFLGFLSYAADKPIITEYLIKNYIYFPPNVLRAIKEELYEDVYDIEDEEYELQD